MIGSVTALHGPQVYGNFGISGAGAIVRAEQKLRKAQSKCTKWTEEYERRLSEDAGTGFFQKAWNQVRKITKPTTGAKRKMDKFCAEVEAAETELSRLRADQEFRAATDPAAQLAAATQMSTAQTQQLLAATGEGPSPIKILGFGGLALGAIGLAVYFLFYR